MATTRRVGLFGAASKTIIFEGEGDQKAAKEWEPDGNLVPPYERVEVLEQVGDFVRVKDTEGKEHWIYESDLRPEQAIA